MKHRLRGFLGDSERRSRYGIDLFGVMTWLGAGSTTASLRDASGTCVDHTVFGAAYAITSIGRHRLSLQLELGDGTGDVFRTRCAGPFGPQSSLAASTAPRSIIGRPSATIPLVGVTPFSDDGYTGRISSGLTLTLSHPRIVRNRATEVVTIAN